MKVIGYLSLGYPTLKRSLTMADDYFEAGCAPRLANAKTVFPAEPPVAL